MLLVNLQRIFQGGFGQRNCNLMTARKVAQKIITCNNNFNLHLLWKRQRFLTHPPKGRGKWKHTSSTEALSGPCCDEAALFSRDRRLSARLAISARLPNTRLHHNITCILFYGTLFSSIFKNHNLRHINNKNDFDNSC